MTSSVRWHRRLSVRLTALIALVTSATIGLLATLAIDSQEQHLLAEAVRGGTLLSDAIHRSIHEHMLLDRREDAYLIMGSIAKQPGLEEIRLFDSNGKITFSKVASEVGTVADRSAAACSACHRGEAPLPSVDTMHAVFTGSDGRRALNVVTPIYNERSCSSAACHVHPDQQRVLGALELGLSLEEADRRTQRLNWTMALLAMAAVPLLALLAMTYIRRAVVQPVRELVRGTRQFAQGKLEAPIPVHTPDELGALAASFNEMTEALTAARGQLTALMTDLEHQVEERTRALTQAQDQLIQSEKMSSLGKLSASVAHEINNPLMGILTVSKLLQRTVEDSKQVADPERALYLKQLKMVQRETERCSAIVRNLLDFARQRPLDLKVIDVNGPLEEALSVAANQIALQGIAVTRELQPDLKVKADFGQLRQSFLNVILNACDAMPKGGTLSVVSKVLESSRIAAVEIGDTGSGIPAEYLSKVFDPFFTTKEKGTGLGLSVVYGIVQRHGGTLNVWSEKGQGTKMRLLLPLDDAKAAERPA